MKKKTKSLGEHLKPVILYRDDLEKIIDILNKGSGEIKIENEEYKFNSLDELKSLKKDFITDIKLSQSTPHVSISFTQSSVWLFASNDSLESVGIYEQIRNHILSRRRKLAWLTENSALGSMCIGFSIWFLLFEHSLYSLFLALSLLTLGALWSWHSFRSTFKRYAVIYPLIYRKEHFGFFGRKKDEICLVIISAILGAVVTLILTKLFK